MIELEVYLLPFIFIFLVDLVALTCSMNVHKKSIEPSIYQYIILQKLHGSVSQFFLL